MKKLLKYFEKHNECVPMFEPISRQILSFVFILLKSLFDNASNNPFSYKP